MLLLFHDWSVIDMVSCSDAYEYLIQIITESLDKHAPKKVVKLSVDEKFCEPWLTVQLMKYNSKCRKLCVKSKSTGNPDDVLKYRRYRNVLNRLKLYEKQSITKMSFKKLERIPSYYGM